MFDMVRNAGDNFGYQLRITYDVGTKKYYVVGYVRYAGKGGITEDERDGAPRSFDTMAEAIAYIVGYGE